MGSGWDWSVPCTCDQCGRIFYPAEKQTWVYKKNGLIRGNKKESDRLFCSWKCLRAFEKTYIPPESNRGRKKEVTA